MMTMSKANYRLLFLLLLLFVSGCDDGKNEADQVQVSSENPFKVQVEAIKQAREGEQLIQVHSEKRQQMVEEQVR